MCACVCVYLSASVSVDVCLCLYLCLCLCLWPCLVLSLALPLPLPLPLPPPRWSGTPAAERITGPCTLLHCYTVSQVERVERGGVPRAGREVRHGQARGHQERLRGRAQCRQLVVMHCDCPCELKYPLEEVARPKRNVGGKVPCAAAPLSKYFVYYFARHATKMKYLYAYRGFKRPPAFATRSMFLSTAHSMHPERGNSGEIK